MIATIHQPEHLPWLGFFHKMHEAETFIALDNVQYRRHYFQNRNRIRTREGEAWITVPVRFSLNGKTLIRDVFIDPTNKNWNKKNLDTLRLHYAKAPHFDAYWESFAETYSQPHERLADFNLALIRLLMAGLGIHRPLRLASELGVSGGKSELLLGLCKAVGATQYHSGVSGRDYLDTQAFATAGIRITYQEFHHPIYTQLHAPFLPCMSALDLLFNYGPGSLDVLLGRGVPVMEDVFL